MPNEYVFIDANTLIYYGKSQLIWGNPTLDRLYIAGSQIVITSRILEEATSNAKYPDGAVSLKWINDGVNDGRITIQPTSGFSGKGGGEASIIATITSSDWDRSIPSRVVTNNRLCCAIWIEAAGIPFAAIFSAYEQSRASRVM